MLIASDPEAALAEPIAAALPVALRYDEVVMHVPVEVAGRARDAAADSGADVVVTVGRGSTTGLGKAVALSTGLPIIAVPTTYAGSETTNVWGMTEGGTTTTGVDDRILPSSIVYDASLLTSLPAEVSAASGLNALAHCVDFMWGPRSDPIDRAMAQEAIRGLAEGLPVVARDAASTAAIEKTLYGAYLAGSRSPAPAAACTTRSAMCPGECSGLPHAQTHAVVLPHVLAFNSPNAPEAERRLAATSGSVTASAGLAELCMTMDAPRALRTSVCQRTRSPERPLRS